MRMRSLPRARRGLATVAVAAAGAWALVGCGSEDVPDTSAPPTATPSAAELSVLETLRVDYYGACGNETLLVDEVTYYPVARGEIEQLDLSGHRALLAEDGDAESTVGADRAVGGTATVQAAIRLIPPPGPGDDVGTMTRFSDGMAYVVSDSGTEYWLSTEIRNLDWEC